MIRLTVPTIEEDDLAAIRAAVASGFLVQGARVAALEAALRERVGTEHVIVVSSGTAALHLSLLALGIGPGDRVAVPAYSFLATANVVEICGATPVFVDIEPQAYAIDPDALERAASRPGGFSAVIPVHPFGQLADMSGIAAAAAGIPVVEDAAPAHRAPQGGRREPRRGGRGRCAGRRAGRPPGGLARQARLLLPSSAQGGDDRRGRGGDDERCRPGAHDPGPPQPWPGP